MSKTVSAALARKLSAGQQGTGNKSRALLRAMRLAVARSSTERIRLPASVIGARQSSKKQEEVPKGLDDGQLLLLFSSVEGRVACVAMDVGFVSAIIQKQTMGEVFPDPPLPRALTDTDAAMVVPLIEDMLSRVLALVEGTVDAARLSGYEFASRAVDIRALSLALVEDQYDVFELTVELDGGRRQGVVSVLLPELSAADGDSGQPGGEHNKTLALAAEVVRAELTAVICRMNLPLAMLSELGVGDVLPLSGARVDKIEVAAIDRTQATKGRLGQCGGLRAVRINEVAQVSVPSQADAPEFVEHRRKEQPLATEDADWLEQSGSDLSDLEFSLDPAEMSTDARDFSGSSTDRIASEISELAGLPAPASKPGV